MTKVSKSFGIHLRKIGNSARKASVGLALPAKVTRNSNLENFFHKIL